jgi:hypothetical protein
MKNVRLGGPQVLPLANPTRQLHRGGSGPGGLPTLGRPIRGIEVGQQTVLAIQRWDQLSAEEQQALIGLLVKQVEVDRFGNVISITWTPIWDQLAGV